jgi:beta-glucosidase
MKNKKSLFLAVVGVLGFGLCGVEAGSSVTGLTAITPIKQSAGTVKKNFYTDYATYEDSANAARDLTTKIAEEGMVMMKNDNNTLPLTGAKNITVFGKNSLSPNIGGGGSGATKGYYKAVGPYEALEAAGFNINPGLKAFYNDTKRSGEGRHGATGFFGGVIDVGETPVEDYDNAVKNTFGAYSDAAIIYVMRTGSEGSDIPTTNVVDDYKNDKVGDEASDGTKKYTKDTHYLELSYNEKQMIKMVEDSKAFKKIVLVVNSSNPIELGSVAKDDNIGGIIWAGGPGGTGFYALGTILNGTTNPSGHTVDIFPGDFTKDPTYKNFGDNRASQDDGTTTNYSLTAPASATADQKATFTKTGELDKYVEYEEGIYVGYKYYETMASDKDAAKAGDGETWYKDNVVYPFGYGLSYTTFEMTLKTTTIDGAEATALTKDSKVVDMVVTVKNTGSVAGKKVVEAFANPDYKDGGIEKASRNLVGFAKTSLLAPGASEDVTIEFNAEDMASYDYNDANKDDHYGYEIDAGKIVVGIQSDSHTVDGGSAIFTAASNIDYQTDGVTDNQVKNLFSTYETKKDASGNYVPDTTKVNPNRSLPMEGDGVKFTAMTRASANHLVTPSAPTATDGQLTDSTFGLINSMMTAANSEGTTDVGDYQVASMKKTKADVVAAFGSDYDQGSTATSVKFADLDGLAYDDPKYQQALNEMPFTEIVEMTESCGWKNGGAASIGKAVAVDIDGPSGIYRVDFSCEATLASTYNVELASEFGNAMGEEGLWGQRNGWYGPAMDTHRSPFSGRCFEYYSEDGLLGGKIAAASIAAAQKKGLYAYTKHFALNDQETQRSGIHVFVSEQAMREIYLKPFRYAVEAGKTKGIMGAMNSIGYVNCYDNPKLMTDLLRSEWGFDGYAETDAGSFTYIGTYSNGYMARVAGCDALLGMSGATTDAAVTKYFGTWDSTKKVPVLDGTELWTLYYYFRQSAHRFLYVTANSNQQKNHLGLDAWKDQSLDAGAGIDFSYDIGITDTKTFGTTNISYTSDNLPAGVSLTTNGILSGNIANNGTYTATVTIHADNWVTKDVKVTLNVAPTFAIDKTEGTAGTAFTAQLSSEKVYTHDVTTGTGNNTSTTNYIVSYALKAGSTLPDGLAMDTNGAITGTPTTAGTYKFTVDVIQLKVVPGWSGSTTTSSEYFQDFTLTIAQAAGYKDPVTSAQETADSAKSDAAAANAAASAANANATSANAAAATANSDAAAAKSDADAANAAAKSAKTLGVVGMVVGIIGIVAACGALVLLFVRKK